MDGDSMRSYWDRRADENAFFYVDSRLRFENPDHEQFWSGGEEDVDAILDALEMSVAATDDVLEVGCGVGRLTRVLAARSKSVIALDVSGRMLELARRHNSELANVTWVQGDGSSLGLVRSESVDLCFSHVVFQHIPDAAITLAYVEDMGRVLRPGGFAAFQISNAPEIHRKRPAPERIRSLPGRLLGRSPRGQSHEAWLGSSVALPDVEDAAKRGGLALTQVEGAGTQWCLVRLDKPGSGP